VSRSAIAFQRAISDTIGAIAEVVVGFVHLFKKPLRVKAADAPAYSVSVVTSPLAAVSTSDYALTTDASDSLG
jgi:hypothetical protein